VGREAGWFGRAWRLILALILLGTFGLLAAGAFPIGVWVGWRVASGGWTLPINSSGNPVTVFRMLAGIVVGFLVYRFGVELRRRLVLEWHANRDAG